MRTTSKADLQPYETEISAGSIIKKRYFFKKLESTNDKALSISDQKSNIAVISEVQTIARGRREKQWYSPAGGLWFSFSILTDDGFTDIPMMNMICSICSVEALIDNTGSDNMQIRWPNDIYLNNKKIAGILIEEKNTENARHIICGIGINTNIDKFPSYLSATSTLIETGRSIENRSLFIDITDRFEIYWEHLSFKKYDFILDKWEYFSRMKGIKIKVNDKVHYTATVRGINRKGQLLITDNKGKDIELTEVMSYEKY